MTPSSRRHTTKHVEVKQLTCFIEKLTLTTRELALPCSYARKAVLKRGKFDTLATKSGEFISAGREEGDEVYRTLDGAGADADADEDGAEMWAHMHVKIVVIERVRQLTIASRSSPAIPHIA